MNEKKICKTSKAPSVVMLRATLYKDVVFNARHECISEFPDFRISDFGFPRILADFGFSIVPESSRIAYVGE